MEPPQGLPRFLLLGTHIGTPKISTAGETFGLEVDTIVGCARIERIKPKYFLGIIVIDVRYSKKILKELGNTSSYEIPP